MILITAIETHTLEPPLGLNPKPERSRSEAVKTREDAFALLASWVFSYAQHKKMLAEDGKSARREADDAWALAESLYKISSGEAVEVKPSKIEETDEATIITFSLLVSPFEWHIEVADV